MTPEYYNVSIGNDHFVIHRDTKSIVKKVENNRAAKEYAERLSQHKLGFGKTFPPFMSQGRLTT